MCLDDLDITALLGLEPVLRIASPLLYTLFDRAGALPIFVLSLFLLFGALSNMLIFPSPPSTSYLSPLRTSLPLSILPLSVAFSTLQSSNPRFHAPPPSIWFLSASPELLPMLWSPVTFPWFSASPHLTLSVCWFILLHPSSALLLDEVTRSVSLSSPVFIFFLLARCYLPLSECCAPF